MIAWLKRLFHHHEWDILSENTYHVTVNGNSYGQTKIYNLRCKICGKLSSEELEC